MTEIVEGSDEPNIVDASAAVPTLVAPPQFSESALTKPRPSAQQVSVLEDAIRQGAAQQGAGWRAAAKRADAQHGYGRRGSAQRAAVEHAANLAIVAMATAPPSAPSLRTRVPAFTVMKQCLRVQSGAPERSRLARLFGREPLHPDARNCYRGALGELEVASTLSRLDPRWTVLHAVPVGSAGADIGHLVIGPGGTFTVNTKNHPRKKIWAGGTGFVVDGQKLAHIHHSTFEAQRAARLLSDVAGTPVAVTPLLVVVNPRSMTRERPDVTVLESAELLRWLKRQPQMQTDATAARIVWAAERRDTWTTLVDEGESSIAAIESGRGRMSERGVSSGQASSSGHAEDPPHGEAVLVEQRFADLRAEIETAESRRSAWLLVGAAVFLAAVAASAMLIAPVVPIV